MPQQQRKEHEGAFQPSELTLFGSVLERLRSKELKERDQQDLAQRIMANYMAGIRDEDELVEVSRRPLGR
jgi:hypothetical protein